MTKNKIKLYKNRQRGIALFIAILTSGVVLIIGASVMEIALKEMKLSSVGRESAKAFYAADTGLECALYWDNITNIDNRGTVFPKNSSEILTGFDCASNLGVTGVTSDASSATTEFGILLGGTDDPCAIITVSKEINGTLVDTTIKSRGYNSCDSANPRRSERGVKSTYTNIY